ncbi:hypothetical protein [Xanthomonas phage DES1]|nr:hypothetical protein [Xanthomonas phage DES1]
MTAKKQVKFKEALFTEVGYGARLFGVKNHYRLGSADYVQTSPVLEIRDDGRTIETKNTIYVMEE